MHQTYEALGGVGPEFCFSGRHRDDWQGFPRIQIRVCFSESSDGDLLRNTQTVFWQFSCQKVGCLIALADDRAAVRKLRFEKTLEKPAQRGVGKCFRADGRVKQKVTVVDGEPGVAQRADTAGIPLQAFLLVAVEDSGDLAVSLPDQVLGEDISAQIVVGADAWELFQPGIRMTEKDNCGSVSGKLFVQFGIRVRERVFGGLYKEAAAGVREQTLQDLPFKADQISGRDDPGVIPCF